MKNQFPFAVISLLVALAVASANAAAPDTIRRSAYPIPSQYIVMLKPDVAANEVESLAKQLARAHDGRTLGFLRHGAKGFGFRGSEAAAVALSHNPNVAFVEEDGAMFTAGASLPTGQLGAFSRSPKLRLPQAPAHQGESPCTWQGCTYYDDTHWNLDRIDQTRPIDAYKNYLFSSTGYGVRAYVIDSGVRYDHVEFFGGQVTAGAAMTYSDTDVSDGPVGNPVDSTEEWRANDPYPANQPCGPNPRPTDYLSGHGTAVASVIGGATTGVAKGVTIVPVKVAGCAEDPALYPNPTPAGSRSPSKLATARGIDWILGQQATLGGRAVVNMSIFTPTKNPYGQDDVAASQGCESYYQSPTLVNCLGAIEVKANDLLNANIPLVVSANNQDNGNCDTSPARMGSTSSTVPHVITVGGTMFRRDANGTNRDERWDCYNEATGQRTCTLTGFDAGSNWGQCVSIWAPAWQISSAHISSTTAYRPQDVVNGTTYETNGTSFAAPAVAGLVARLLQANSSLSVLDVWNALASRAHHTGINFNATGPYNDMIARMGTTE